MALVPETGAPTRRRRQLRIAFLALSSLLCAFVSGCYLRFPSRLRDAYRLAGIGWGNTRYNDFAVFRIGQVWINDGLRPASLIVRKTMHTDPRMVICDRIVCRGGYSTRRVSPTLTEKKERAVETLRITAPE